MQDQDTKDILMLCGFFFLSVSIIETCLTVHPTNSSTNFIYSQVEEASPGIFGTGTKGFLLKVLLFNLVGDFVSILFKI